LSSAKVKPVRDKAAVTAMTQRAPNVSLITLKRWPLWELGVIAGGLRREKIDARILVGRGKWPQSICRDSVDFASG
jgi:hypothetical protein